MSIPKNSIRFIISNLVLRDITLQLHNLIPFERPSINHPSFTQLNTPYPATCNLKDFLNTKNISAFQMDLGIEVILKLFSKETFQDIFETAFKNEQ